MALLDHHYHHPELYINIFAHFRVRAFHFRQMQINRRSSIVLFNSGGGGRGEAFAFNECSLSVIF